ncbi:MAG: amidohydrolase family protein, partial [Proteobacteria bacterium]|nr:amidohydrolase family protein [Pseudomonadota bacterium]
RYGIRSRRWVLEHMSLSGMDDLRALKALGVGVTLIPLHHIWKNGASFFDLGEAESELVVPAKQLRELGVPVAAGTDNTPYDPLAVIYAMMCREERTTKRVIGEAGKVSAEAALDALTWAGAWFTFEEDRKGRLVAGHFADCAVLSQNPLTAAPQELDQIICLATLVDGSFVYGP